jgi:hypothetical protein
MSDNLTAADRFGHLVGQHVTVTFSDDGEPEVGTLAGAGWDAIEVTQTDGTDEWTSRFSLAGDDETPHVIGMRPTPVQAESLF